MLLPDATATLAVAAAAAAASAAAVTAVQWRHTAAPASSAAAWAGGQAGTVGSQASNYQQWHVRQVLGGHLPAVWPAAAHGQSLLAPALMTAGQAAAAPPSALKRPAREAVGRYHASKRVHFSVAAAGAAGAAQQAGATISAAPQPHAPSRPAQLPPIQPQQAQAPATLPQPAHREDSQWAQAQGGSHLMGVPPRFRLDPVWEEEDDADSRPQVRPMPWAPPQPGTQQRQHGRPQTLLQANRRRQPLRQAVEEQWEILQQRRRHAAAPTQPADSQRTRLAALIVTAKRQDSAAAVLQESLVADFLKLLPISPAQVGMGVDGGSGLLCSIAREQASLSGYCCTTVVRQPSEPGNMHSNTQPHCRRCTCATR